MGFKKNNPGCNCCSPTCAICSGNCGWTQEAGSIDTVSFAPDLLIDGSDSIATCDADAASGTVAVRASVTVVAESGDVVKLGIKYVDTSNYWYVELTPGASGTLKLFERSGGTSTQRGPTMPIALAGDDTYGLTICYGSGLVRATESVSGIAIPYATTTSSTSGLSAFVGTGTIAGTPLFSDFLYEYGYSASGHSTCTDCDCSASCSIGSSSFTSGDTSDIGYGVPTGFEEASGAWDITSNQLRCTSAGVALFNTTTPCGTTPMIVQVQFKHSTDTDSVDVIVGAVDSTHYFYARYDFSADRVSIRKNNGGTHSTLATAIGTVPLTNDGTVYTARVCVDNEGTITAYYGAGFVAQVSSFAQSVTGIRCGLSSTAGTATFDNFSFSQSDDGNDNGCSVCPPKPATCADCCPITVTEFILDWSASFTSITCDGNCETLVSGEYTLTGSGSSCTWTYFDYSAGADCGCTDGRTQTQLLFGTGSGDGGPDSVLLIKLDTLLDANSPARCYLRLRIQVNNIDGSIAGCVNKELLSANYESSTSINPLHACSGDEFTLTLVDPGTIATTYRGNTGWLDQYSAGCTGSLPATVTVRAA